MGFLREWWSDVRANPVPWAGLAVGALVMLYLVGGIWINLPFDPFRDDPRPSSSSQRDLDEPQRSPVPVGPTPPPLPSEAKQNTVEGAEAFARYYMDLSNYARETLDAGPWKKIFDPGCERCQAIVENFDIAKNRGDYAEGGRYSVDSIVVNRLEPDRYLARITFDVSERQQYYRDGKPIDGDPAPATSNNLGVLDAAWVDGRFQVYHLEAVK